MSELNPENKCSNLLEGQGEIPTPTIEQMFDMQLELQKFYAGKGKALDPDSEDFLARVRDMSIQWKNLSTEFAEFIERLPHKDWKNYTEEDILNAFSGDAYVETEFEYIDMWHFFMNIGLLLGIRGKRFSQLYYIKNKENYDRQNRGY